MRESLYDKIITWIRKFDAVVATISAFVFMLGLHVWRDTANTITSTWWLCLIAFLLYKELFRQITTLTKRYIVTFSLFGTLCAFFVVADPLVYTPTGIPRAWSWYAVVAFVFFAVMLSGMFCGLSILYTRFTGFLSEISTNNIPKTNLTNNDKTINKPEKSWRDGIKSIFTYRADAVIGPKTWVMYTAILMAFWTVVVLATGPLRISADSYNVMQQALGNYPLQDNHPILYTLILRVFLTVGEAIFSVQVGAWMFAVFQMLVLASMLSFSLYVMRAQGCPFVLVVLSLGYFTLTPVFAVNAITLWKDILFNAVLLILIMLLYKIVESKGEYLQTKKGCVVFLVVAFFACFMRGNGFFIVAAAMFGICVVFWKQWKRWVLLFLPFLVCVQLVLGPVYDSLGLTGLGKIESTSLPMQQVARAVKNGAELSENQLDVIESFMPVQTMKDAYVSSSPDFIKNHPQFDSQAFDENYVQFLQLWIELAVTNTQDYLDAWLLTTLGYWKVDFYGWTALMSEYEADVPVPVYSSDLYYQVFGVDMHSFFAARTKFFSLGQLAFMVVFCAAHMVAVKREKYVVCLVPMLVLWVGLMVAAPTYAEFRYMLVFAYALPFVLHITAFLKKSLAKNFN